MKTKHLPPASSPIIRKDAIFALHKELTEAKPDDIPSLKSGRPLATLMLVRYEDGPHIATLDFEGAYAEFCSVRENISGTDYVQRLIIQAAARFNPPKRKLSSKALKRLEDMLEAEQACGDPKTATALDLILSWYKEEHP